MIRVDQRHRTWFTFATLFLLVTTWNANCNADEASNIPASEPKAPQPTQSPVSSPLIPQKKDNELNPQAIVDDCCCEVDTLFEHNHKEINPLLESLASRRFFKYFKLDLFAPCPLWVSSGLCSSGGCAICECDEDEVPKFWKQQKTDLVSVDVPPNFVSWSDVEENMWTIQGKEEDMSYINLELYPEANTGYKDGGLVWERIYKENCFIGPLDSMCLEERVFYRLISGLHTSISTHVCRKFELDKTTGTWKANVPLFEKLVGRFPDRIKNLYFSYLFLLRAVHRVAPFLDKYHYNTGNPKEDSEVKELMGQLLTSKLLCSPNFDESLMFNGPEKEALKQQMKSHFRNISQIMNCVSCEKCKAWAKLEVLGIGTALKLLLETKNSQGVIYQIQRNEIIALVNTLRQFSSAIEAIREMQTATPEAMTTTGAIETKLLHPKSFYTLLGSLVFGLAFVILFSQRHRLFYNIKTASKDKISKNHENSSTSTDKQNSKVVSNGKKAN